MTGPSGNHLILFLLDLNVSLGSTSGNIEILFSLEPVIKCLMLPTQRLLAENSLLLDVM